MHRFHLAPRHPIPISVQLRAQICHQIRLGLIRPGESLPSVRALAARLGLNRNTVLRVMAELETMGYVTTQPGRGIFVADDPPVPGRAAELRWVIGRMLDHVAGLDLSVDELALTLLAHGQLAEVAPTPQRRVLIVGGEYATLRALQRVLETALPLMAEPVLSDTLPERWGEAIRSRTCPPVLATLAHAAEAERTVAGTAPVIPLAGEQERSQWARLLRQPAGTPVAVLAADWVHAARLRVAIAVAAPDLNLRLAAGSSPEDFTAALAGAAYAICPRTIFKPVAAALAGRSKIQLLIEPVNIDDDLLSTIRQVSDAPHPTGGRYPRGISPWF